jgi:hypothetical protein
MDFARYGFCKVWILQGMDFARRRALPNEPTSQNDTDFAKTQQQTTSK